ncbi:MAG TPA: hypothetical protein VK574_00485 [Terracidiphilus sp.]|nr:hypothetical protein [Terracidiphilus sp.]
MNRNPKLSKQTPVTSFQVGHGLACLILLLSLCAGSTGQAQSGTQSPVPGAAIHVTHVLGFEGVRHNATGQLRIKGDAVQFQRDGSLTAQVKLSSIEDLFVEDEDKEVGGTAMMLGKTAAPFGGGRVVSLFAHKKYDVLTVEYRDNNGGFHGAIFQLDKGQGQTFKKDLVANGTHISSPDDQATTQSAPEVKQRGGAQPWSVQVDRVDRGDVGLQPSFGAAIYENLLEELTKTKQFTQSFRGGDRNANDVSSILTLKTTVQKYTPGSETRRAVTTVNGATKLNVHVQLVTREGHVVLDKSVDGNVRFFGDNLRATHNLAHNIAETLKRSTLPERAEPVSDRETGQSK